MSTGSPAVALHVQVVHDAVARQVPEDPARAGEDHERRLRACGAPVGGRGPTSSRPRRRRRAAGCATMQRPTGGGPSMVRSTGRRSRQARWWTRISNGGASGLFQLPATGSDVRKVYDDAPPAPRTGMADVTADALGRGERLVRREDHAAHRRAAAGARPAWRAAARRRPRRERAEVARRPTPTMVIDEAGDAWRNAGPGYGR